MKKISLACIWIPSLRRSRLIHRSLTLFICRLVVHEVTAAHTGNRLLQYVTNRNVATTTNTSSAPQAWRACLTSEAQADCDDFTRCCPRQGAVVLPCQCSASAPAPINISLPAILKKPSTTHICRFAPQGEMRRPGCGRTPRGHISYSAPQIAKSRLECRSSVDRAFLHRAGNASATA